MAASSCRLTYPTMVTFVTSLAEDGKKIATIQHHCASVSKAHQLAGFPTPTDNRQFKTLRGGIRREKGIKKKQAPAFTLACFKRVVQGIDTERPNGVPGSVAARPSWGIPTR